MMQEVEEAPKDPTKDELLPEDDPDNYLIQLDTII